MLSEKTWRAEAVLQFCAAQIGCLCLGGGLIWSLHHFGVRGFQQDESLGSIVAGTLSFQGATWLLIPFFLRQHHLGWRAAFGFCGPRIRQPFRLALTCLGVFAAVMLLQGLSVRVLEKAGFHSEDQAAIRLLTDAKSVWTTVYLGLFAVVIAPVAEEFIFRGLLFPFVKQQGFPKLAWFGVSFLFALIHLNAPTLVPLFGFALALTWLYQRTDNLLAPITAHMAFNAVNYAMLLWQLHPAHP